MCATVHYKVEILKTTVCEQWEETVSSIDSWAEESLWEKHSEQNCLLPFVLLNISF